MIFHGNADPEEQSHDTERFGLSISPAARNSHEIEASTRMVDRYLAPFKKLGTSVWPEVKSFSA